MKRLIWILGVIVVVGAAVTWRAFSMSVPHRADVTATPEMVKRGAYLVTAADCISCHTAEGNQPFAGGREFDLGSMGKLYSPNITPDKETGIGSWSDDDFRAALQLGVGKGGVHLYPAFPYASFTLLTDEDVLAIKAYLFSLKPVHYSPPPDAMSFPYNQRFLMAYWSWLFDPNERFAPETGKSDEWNRGKYLVEALGHCGECHTERNFLQAVERSKAYGGAITQKWKAYDISPDMTAGLGGWSDDAVVSYLSTGFAKAHGPASGPMAEVVSNSLRLLPATDIHAMVTYLRSLPPVESTVPVAASVGDPVGADADLQHGRQVYARDCANCHRLNGGGIQTEYEALGGSQSVSDPQAINLTQAVLYGSTLQTANGQVQMLGFGRGLSDIDAAAVVNFASRELGGHSPNLTPDDIAARR
ncbi:MAG TPA: cytochrome c [Steroidobacteraceae bacterium]|nr:cytochrome c [Steroidobacteraceae bacterium]